MYRLNRNLHRLSKQTLQHYNKSRTQQTSIYKFLSKYTQHRGIHNTNNHTIKSTSIITNQSLLNTPNPLQSTNISPLTSTYSSPIYQHSKRKLSTPSPQSQPPPIYEITPPRRSLADCIPQTYGKGIYIDTTLSPKKVEIAQKDMVPMDGNTSAAYIAYANSEVSFIYPISPATSMGEAMDTFSAAGKTNCVSNQQVRVEVMQSEGGAAGALHGALAAGALTSTFTASQGLLLMIPNMYLIAGELMPCVIHVSARTVAKQALCIYNDHSDVMAVRQCGWAMLCSNTPQEVIDLALVSHLATVKSRVPFLHFFDGNRTSSEIQKIHRIPYEDIAKLVRPDLIDKNLRSLSLNPVAPIARGTGQRPDIFFQSNMASERFYRECTKHIESSMDEVEELTGRRYNLFDYFGHPEAENIAVVMGSAGNTTTQYVRSEIGASNRKIGVMKVKCYRPWSAKHFYGALPSTVKRIAVLDRTREEGALGNPLFLDVSVSLRESENFQHVVATGGSIGIGQKEVQPSMIEAVFKNLDNDEMKTRYTVGINDDVTFTSLDYNLDKRSNDNSLPSSTRQCIFWGLGSDGTVGANKEAIKMIGDHTPLNCQGYFAYDSKKSGGVTCSQLRFGPENIESEYQICSADYVAVHNSSAQFIDKLDLLGAIKPNGIFVLNSPWTIEEFDKKFPARMKRQIAQNDVQFYNIDAGKIARSVGLRARINMIMQSVFYKLGNVIPSDEATDLLKSSIKRMFGKKGEEIVNMNINAVDQAGAALQKIDYPKDKWLNAVDSERKIDEWDHLLYAGVPDFVSNVMEPCMNWAGDELPVSAFEPGGAFPVGTTRYERRGAAPEIPVWIADKCTQCNYCSIVCPHAVIRPFLLNKEETKNAPPKYEVRKAQGGSNFAGLNYTIQVAPMDCTGCAVCVQACPDDALFMGDFEQYAHEQLPHFEYSMTMPNRNPGGDKYSVKGSQFEQPLLEFHGACAGCGETPYVKLVTQLFGQQMMIANASGCSSVWGGTCTTHPYTTNKETGHGPAWGRSLFEDNAEYGYGMALASLQRRRRLFIAVQNLIQNISEDMVSNPKLLLLLKQWVKTYDVFVANNAICDELDQARVLSECRDDHPLIYNIYKQRDMFRPQSQWLIGGDGWAYDIGQGGLDHILSKGENINILILDTEIYSNTGGQSSKASVAGQVTKFESLGKTRHKKDLGATAIAYQDVYTASIALGADYNQAVKTLKEAAEYPGTSVIMAYSPCIDWGIDTKDMADIQRVAVETGYWELYRYDPRLRAKGENPLKLDSRRIKKPVKKYLESENRFRQLQRQHKERAEVLQGSLETWIHTRHDKLLRQSMDDLELLDFLKEQLGEDASEKILLLYGSETGNAAEFSQIISTDLQKRGIRAKVMACDDYDANDLAKERTIIFIVATCGQGELPANSKDMYNTLKSGDFNLDLSATQVAVFGMGDSHYVYFNEAAKLYDDVLRNKLGAQMIMDDYGKGDDQDDEKYESAWEEFGPSMCTKLMLPEPEKILLPATYTSELHTDLHQVEEKLVIPSGASVVPIVENRLLTPTDYDRDTRHYEFDTTGMTYEVGDSLGVYAHNDPEKVSKFCEWYGFNECDVVRLVDNLSGRKDALPSNITVNQLFTQVLDIFGRPKRRFYELLSLVATDQTEKGKLENLSNEEYKFNISETKTHADLLKQFPSARPSIEHMIDYIPKIKPRLYSIASSPHEQPNNIALCVIVDDWTTPTGKEYKKGLCSNYLTLQNPQNNDKVIAKVNAGVVAMPDHHEVPIVMSGLGTGLAPLRGMVRDRAYAIKSGDISQKDAGDMVLYFGARYRRNEFLYEPEWEDFHQNGKGPLTHLRTAFSRDQDYKIYIQDKIMEDPELIHEYLVNQKGYFYACGSSAVQDLKHYVAKCIAKVGNMSEEEGAQYVTQMMIENRYCIESW